MRKISFTFAYVVITSILLSGCVATGQNRYISPAQQQADASCAVFSKKLIFSAAAGAATGAAAGALIGRDKKSTLIGAGIGLLLGGALGKTLDSSDCAAAQVAVRAMDTAPVNMPVVWSNPRTGNSGTFTPTSAPAIDKSSGRLCRAYRQQATLQSGEQSQEQTGLTCRDQNGDWQLVT